MLQETSKDQLYTEITRKMRQPKLGPEPKWSLCASLRSRNACPHIRKNMRRVISTEITRKMPRPRLGPKPKGTLCASLRNRNACPHATGDIRRATLHRTLEEKCHGPEWAQKTDVVRACAIEMHVHMSQETSEEQLYTEICRKNAAAQIGPRMQRTLCASLRNRNACQDFTRATLCGNLQAKCRRPEWAP